MALDSKHPLYNEHVVDWQQMRDTFEGERRVKERGFTYLPATSGMVEDGALSRDGESKGWTAYKAYRARALFHDWVKEAVKALLGVMHRKPPVIELPSVMEPLREFATAKGESLDALLRRINREQLITGRLGLLADVFDQGARANQPYIAVYIAEDVLNWDEGVRTELKEQKLNLVVLNETSYERTNDFDWELVRKYRVLLIGDPMANEPVGTYRVGVFKEDAFNEADLIEPAIKGRRAEEIPFVFCNAQDVVSEPDDPPLIGLSNLCLAIYRGEADYRQSLFMQGQDTLVVVGSTNDTDIRIGANARIDLPIGGSAEFIGVSGQGLPEQRTAIENDDKMAAQMSGQLLDSVSRERESGEALTVRVAARTATLNQIALAGAFALQAILRKVATWMGANPQEVIVTPNLDFVDDVMTGQELGQLMAAKTMGAPISLATIHKIMEDRGLTEMTLDEEVEAIEEEKELELVPPEPTDEASPENDRE